MRPLLLLVFCALVSCVESENVKQKISTPKEEIPSIETLINKTSIEEKETQGHDSIPKEDYLYEGEKKIIFSIDAEYYYGDSEFNLLKFLTEIDSSEFFDAKGLEINGVDRDAIIEPVEGELIVNTKAGPVVYEIKTFDEFGYEGNEFWYQGFSSSLGVHIVREDVAEGFGYDLIFDTDKRVLRVNGFPCFSEDGKHVLTYRIEAENEVSGFVKLYGFLANDTQLLWEAWSDYSMLPIDAVWESDSTILLKLHDYPDENSYYKRKGEKVRYGRLVIDNITDSF